MAEKLAELRGAGEGLEAAADGWHELAVANPTFLLERLGSECSDIQGLRELTVNGLDAIAALGASRLRDRERGGAQPLRDPRCTRSAAGGAARGHWTIHNALIAYQDAAERRRQLATEVGERVGELIASLVAAGWSERDAREANIPNLISAGGDL